MSNIQFHCLKCDSKWNEFSWAGCPNCLANGVSPNQPPFEMLELIQQNENHKAAAEELGRMLKETEHNLNVQSRLAVSANIKSIDLQRRIDFLSLRNETLENQIRHNDELRSAYIECAAKLLEVKEVLRSFHFETDDLPKVIRSIIEGNMQDRKKLNESKL